MARRYTGPNWTLLKRICATVGIVAGLYVAYPMAICTAERLAAANIGDFQAAGPDRGFQATATGNTAGFVRRLTGSVTGCFTVGALQERPLEAQFTALGGFGGWLLFSILGRIDTRRRLRRAAEQQRKARQGLQRERTSRSTTGSGHPAVPGGATGVPRLAVTAGAEAVPRAVPSGAFGHTGGPLGGDDDVLSRLDEEFERESSGLNEAVAFDSGLGSDTRADDRTTDGMGDSFDGMGESFDGARPRSSAGLQAVARGQSGPHAGPGSPGNATLSGELPDLGDLDWDDGDNWSGDPISEAAPPVSPRAAVSDAFEDTLAPGAADLAAALGSYDEEPREYATQITGLVPEGVLRLGESCVLQLTGDGIPRDGGTSVTVSVAVMAPDGELAACFTDRALRDFAIRDVTGSTARVTLSWQDVSLGVLEAARGLANGAVALRVAVRDAHGESVCDVPLTDRLRASVSDQFGAINSDTLLLVRDATGAMYAARPDTGGRFDLEGVVPGLVRVWRADQGILQIQGGAQRTDLELATTGVSFALPSGQVDGDAQHQWVAWRANQHYVEPGVERGDGTRDRPFGSVQEAIDTIVGRRRGASHAFDYDELRIGGAVSHPGQRVGAYRQSDGTGEWWRWWGGQEADTKRNWFRVLEVRDVQSRTTSRIDGAVREDFVAMGVDRLRIVGVDYAEAFDGWNTGSVPLVGSLEAALEATPLAVIARPDVELAEPYRISIRSSRHLFLGGLHIAGGRGQTGLDLREVQNAHLFRCWIDGFESGSTAHSGVVGVGRGLQVEGSGRGPSSERVHIERCDIGYNRAQRRSMPIRGAGMAIYNSVVQLTACVLHNNTSTQDPAGLSADGASTVSGTGNHREANQSV